MINDYKGETLPNGVYIRRQWNNTNHYGDESFHDEWLASINIGGWHYSHGGDTQDQAISGLYKYMESQKANFKEIIRINEQRHKDLTVFLDGIKND